MADQLITGTTLIEDKRSGRGEIWSIPGIAFTGQDPETNPINYGNDGTIVHGAGALDVIAPVNIPNGATIKKVVVYASVSDLTWALERYEIDGASSQVTMATAVTNTEDTTIVNSTINNENFRYHLWIDNLDADSIVYGARITYEF